MHLIEHSDKEIFVCRSGIVKQTRVSIILNISLFFSRSDRFVNVNITSLGKSSAFVLFFLTSFSSPCAYLCCIRLLQEFVCEHVSFFPNIQK